MAESPPSKRQNPSENTTDRISNLPQSLLHHILSFLPTKQAAQTSLLSKQWQHLWTWVPNLHLDNRELSSKNKSFERIVSDILLSRRARCIKIFTLSCNYDCNCSYDRICDDDCDYSNLGLFLCAAVLNNVEELNFFIENSHNDRNVDPFLLPQSLFTCRTLVVLKLRGDIDTSFSSVRFPNLKVLHLHDVKYQDEGTVRSLFSGCPVLDEVYIQRHDNDHVDVYEVSSTTVRKLVLLNGEGLFGYSFESKIIVNAPALEHLTIDYNPPPWDLVLRNMPKLVEANLHVRYPMVDEQWDEEVILIDWDKTMDILRILCNVQFLELKFSIVEAPGHYITSCHNLPVFDNLVELKLNGLCCSWSLLMQMLCNCTRLQDLTLVRQGSGSYRYSYCEEPQLLSPPQRVPNCLSSHLTTFTFEGFRGLGVEMEFIKYVLKNSKVLTDVLIRSEILEDLVDAFRDLLVFERGSAECEIYLEEGKVESLV